MMGRAFSTLFLVLFSLACEGETLYDVPAPDAPTPSGTNRAPTAQLAVEPQAIMSPVQARLHLTCNDPDGDQVTHILSYSGSAASDVQSVSAVDITRSFLQTTQIRGSCRDSRGASSTVATRQLLVINGDAHRDSVLVLTNSARTGAGVASLVLDARLTAFALAHARDMAERGYFSHTTPDGKTFSTRLREAGISGPAGENIAGNFSAAGAVQAWLNSSGHRANMLNGTFRRLGVGVYRTLESPYTYYVQVFTN